MGKAKGKADKGSMPPGIREPPLTDSAWVRAPTDSAWVKGAPTDSDCPHFTNRNTDGLLHPLQWGF